MKYTQVETDPRYQSISGESSVSYATFVDEVGGRYQLDIAVHPKTKEFSGFLILERVRTGDDKGKYKLVPLIFGEAIDFFMKHKTPPEVKPVPKSLWKKTKDFHSSIIAKQALKIKQLELKIEGLKVEIVDLQGKVRELSKGHPLWNKIISLDSDLKMTVKTLKWIRFDPIGIVSMIMAIIALRKIKNTETLQRKIK